MNGARALILISYQANELFTFDDELVCENGFTRFDSMVFFDLARLFRLLLSRDGFSSEALGFLETPNLDIRSFLLSTALHRKSTAVLPYLVCCVFCIAIRSEMTLV